MKPIKTQEIFIPTADNSETPYSVVILKELENKTDFVTAVERRTDMYLFTKEELEKIIGEAFEAGENCGFMESYNFEWGDKKEAENKSGYVARLFKPIP